MNLSIELPDPIARQLHLDGEHGQQRALTMFALEGYRAGDLSRGQVSELLGLSFHDTEAFLKKHGCGLGLSIEEYERSKEHARKFLVR